MRDPGPLLPPFAHKPSICTHSPGPTGSLGKNTYYHIHYGPAQPTKITLHVH